MAKKRGFFNSLLHPGLSIFNAMDGSRSGGSSGQSMLLGNPSGQARQALGNPSEQDALGQLLVSQGRFEAARVNDAAQRLTRERDRALRRIEMGRIRANRRRVRGGLFGSQEADLNGNQPADNLGG